jgi:hypothetical protein
VTQIFIFFILKYLFDNNDGGGDDNNYIYSYNTKAANVLCTLVSLLAKITTVFFFLTLLSNCLIYVNNYFQWKYYMKLFHNLMVVKLTREKTLLWIFPFFRTKWNVNTQRGRLRIGKINFLSLQNLKFRKLWFQNFKLKIYHFKLIKFNKVSQLYTSFVCLI